MKVRVRFFGIVEASVASHDRAAGIETETTEGAAYRDLVKGFGLNPGGGYIFSVGGVMKRPDDPVNEGDMVDIITPFGGG